MQVEKLGLLDLVGSSGITFSIPGYQRGYTWTWRQCRELWLDIMRAERGGWEHFTGTVFCQESEGGECAEGRILEVADGQQRITTTMLLLAALANKVESIGGAEDVPSGDEIRRQYLAAPDGRSPKFTPRADEGDDFASIVLDARTPPGTPQEVPKDPLAHVDDDDDPNRHEANMRYFERLMSQDGFDPAKLWSGLNRLSIISATLGKDDDGQEVFESLNGKGVQLCLADMLRNYLLASWDEQEQMRLYDEYWSDIDGIFAPDPGSRKLDNGIHGWLAVRFPKARAHSPEDLYSAFKRFVEDEYEGTPDDLLAELRSFSLVWAENYRYHSVKRFKSEPWAKVGAHTLTSSYKVKEPSNKEYAARLKSDIGKIKRYW